MAITVQNASVHTLLGQTFSEINCFYMWQNVCIGLRDAVVAVAFRAKDCGFKSTHGCSHTMKKPSINPRLFGQWTLNIYLPYSYHLPLTLSLGPPGYFGFPSPRGELLGPHQTPCFSFYKVLMSSFPESLTKTSVPVASLVSMVTMIDI